MSVIKVAIASVFALLLSIGVTMPPVAEAQVQSGLVNVAIGDITTGDILSNNRVGIGVAANVAANVCGVTAQVGVIAEQVARTGNYRCENTTTSRFVQITR
jgi:hypothetical protein